MILSGYEIERAIKQAKPRRIAVAYIGADWRSYLTDPAHIEAVIISPTLGTNPAAVIDLVKEIGWERVHFLDELHAKIYIGKSAAVVGSANLTHNGLSGEKLIEVCVELNNAEAIKQINVSFDDILKRARSSYGSVKKKKERLAYLDRLQNEAIANGLMKNRKVRQNDFADFELLSNNQFYVSWYDSHDGYEFLGNLKEIESEIDDDMHFAQGDKVERGKWILVWKLAESGRPDRRKRPYWMFIHDVYKNAVDGGNNYEYPGCAIQRKKKDKPTQPFEITKNVAHAFWWALSEPEVSRYLMPSENKVYRIADSAAGIPLLLAKMKTYIGEWHASK